MLASENTAAFLSWATAQKEIFGERFFLAAYSALNGRWDEIKNDLRKGEIKPSTPVIILEKLLRFGLIGGLDYYRLLWQCNCADPEAYKPETLVMIYREGDKYSVLRNGITVLCETPEDRHALEYARQVYHLAAAPRVLSIGNECGEVTILESESKRPAPETYEKEFIAAAARNGNPPRLLKNGLTPHERRARLRQKAEAGEYRNDLFSTPEATGQTEIKF